MSNYQYVRKKEHLCVIQNYVYAYLTANMKLGPPICIWVAVSRETHWSS